MDDLEPLIEAYKFKKAVNSAFKKYEAKLLDRKDPGCIQHDIGKNFDQNKI